jgi:hypothetical protein
MNLLAKSSLIIIALTLAAVLAEATPARGDRSVFNVKLSKGTQITTGKLTFELTSYDKSTDQWVQTSTTDLNGQKQTKTETVATSDLLDDATIDSIITNCVARGGKTETITSPAGSFPSCAVPINNSKTSGTVWVAKVPFGYCKWILSRSDGLTVDSLLESFVAGTPQ